MDVNLIAISQLVITHCAALTSYTCCYLNGPSCPWRNTTFICKSRYILFCTEKRANFGLLVASFLQTIHPISAHCQLHMKSSLSFHSSCFTDIMFANCIMYSSPPPHFSFEIFLAETDKRFSCFRLHGAVYRGQVRRHIYTVMHLRWHSWTPLMHGLDMIWPTSTQVRSRSKLPL